MPFAPAIGLLAVFAAALVLSLAASWDVTFGPLLRGLADAVARVRLTIAGRTIVGLGFLASAILEFEAALRRRIGEAVGAMAAPLTRLLRAVTHAFTYPAVQLATLADDVAETLWALRRVVIPAMIAAKIGWISKHLAALEHEAVHVVKRISRVVVHDVPHVVKPTVIRVARAVANPALPRIGHLEREAGALLDRVRGLTRRLAPAAVAALVVAQLARLGLGWIRCSRVKRAGKQVCGMDTGLLDSLIADTLIVVGTISLVEFAEGLQAGMRGVTPQIRRFWRAG